MKTLNPFPLMFTFLLLNGGTALVASAQIAAGYPGDINIQNDPNVLFSEMFEENMTQMQSN